MRKIFPYAALRLHLARHVAARYPDNISHFLQQVPMYWLLWEAITFCVTEGVDLALGHEAAPCYVLVMEGLHHLLRDLENEPEWNGVLHETAIGYKQSNIWSLTEIKRYRA